MFLEETPEQLALRQELRAYYAELLTDEVRQGHRRGRRGRRAVAPGRGAHRQGRLARHRVAQGVRRPGPPRHRPVHLLRRDPPGRCAVPVRDREHGGPDDHAVRQRRAEELLPPRHPGRRGQLRHRLHRARGGHGPGLVAHAGRARRRRVRRERGQGLHERRRHGGLRVAGGAHQPGRPQAQGHLHPVHVDRLARLLVEPHRHRGGRPDHGHLLLRRPRARRATGGGRERGLADDHHPAQPRAGGPGRLERLRLPALRGGRATWAAATPTPDGAPGARSRVGAVGPGPVPGRARGHVPPQLAHGRRACRPTP